MGIPFHRGPFMAEGKLEPGRGLVHRVLWKMNEGGCRNGASLSEKAP